MDSNKELSANIKINAESNVEEQVEKAQKSLDSLTKSINSSKNTTSSNKITTDDLDEINRELEKISNTYGVITEQTNNADKAIEELNKEFEKLGTNYDILASALEKNDIRTKEIISFFENGGTGIGNIRYSDKATYTQEEGVAYKWFRNSGLTDIGSISLEDYMELSKAIDAASVKSETANEHLARLKETVYGLSETIQLAKDDSQSLKDVFSDLNSQSITPDEILNSGTLDSILVSMQSIRDTFQYYYESSNEYDRNIYSQLIGRIDNRIEQLLKLKDELENTTGKLEQGFDKTFGTLKASENISSGKNILEKYSTYFSDTIQQDKLQIYKSSRKGIEEYKNALNEIEETIKNIKSTNLFSEEQKRDANELVSKLEELKGNFEQNKPTSFNETVLNIKEKYEDIIGLIGLISKSPITDASIKALKFGYEEAGKALEDLKNIGINTKDSLINTFKSLISIIDDTINKIIDLGREIKTLSNTGVDLQQKWFTAYSYFGSERGDTLKSFLGDLETIYGLDGDNIISSLKDISVLVSNIGLDASNSEKAIEALTLQSLDLSAFTGIDYDSIVNNLNTAVVQGYLSRQSPIVKALGLSKDDIANFKQLNTEAERLSFILNKGEYTRGSYERWLNTTAGRITLLNNATSRLEGNTGRLAMTLYAQVAPIITKIINLLNELVDGLVKLFNIDTTSAIANIADTGSVFDNISNSIDNVSDSLDKTTSSAEETRKNIASFDDVIQLSDNEQSKIDDELSNLGVYEDIGNVLNNFNLDNVSIGIDKAKSELADFFKLLNNGEYELAGLELNSIITEKLDSIDWNTIKDKAKNIAYNISSFLNGVFGNTSLFKSLGNTFAETINTVTEFVNSLFDEFNFSNLGKGLSQNWKNFWYNFDSKSLGKALFNVIHGAFETFWSFVDDMWKVEDFGADGWVTAGFKLADTINTLFSSWTTEDVEKAANSIIDFINGIFRTLAAFLLTLDTQDIKDKIQTFIHTLFTGFAENASEWGEVVGDFIDFIIDMIDMLISEWDSAGMTNAILTFLENSHISELVAKWMQVKLKIWWNEFLAGVLIKGEALLQTIDSIGKKIGEVIIGIVAGIPLIILGFFTQLGVDISNALMGIGESFGEWVYDLVHGLIDSISEFIDWIGNKISGLFDAISNISLPSISDIGSGISNFVGKIDIPFLASGGIASRATPAIIGEDGREAVLPLENNTGWMDILANKTAQSISGVYNPQQSQSVIIDMSKSIKPIYTRSEMLAFGRQVVESLKIYGVQVSINT